jgi:hypothetical protein
MAGNLVHVQHRHVVQYRLFNATPGRDLDVLEEDMIRANGGYKKRVENWPIDAIKCLIKDTRKPNKNPRRIHAIKQE